MTTNIALHHCRALRCSSFYPENSGCVSLKAGGTEVTLYDLPIEKALALAMMFADADTAVFFKFGHLGKLLDHMADPGRTGPLAGFPATKAPDVVHEAEADE